ncbi:metal-dependent hydrolase [Planctomycetales bacterium]|nr:metal-dependent hydrolase [Planctomycetales bacterium]
MRMVSLQSGSNGNCIYVESGGVRLLFDAGLTGKRTEERLNQIGVSIDSIQGVFLSHDHSDHCSGAGVLHRQYGLPVWMTKKTYDFAAKTKRFGIISEPNFFCAGKTVFFKHLAVETISTTHDAVDGVGFIIDDGNFRLGILTDLGHIFPALPLAISTLDGVLLESNYDPDMLRDGPYSSELQQRIRGKGGHLSNVEAAKLLFTAGGKLRWACLGHISQENNHPDIVTETHRRMLSSKLPFTIASRHECSEVMEL